MKIFNNLLKKITNNSITTKRKVKPQDSEIYKDVFVKNDNDYINNSDLKIKSNKKIDNSSSKKLLISTLAGLTLFTALSSTTPVAAQTLNTEIVNEKTTESSHSWLNRVSNFLEKGVDKLNESLDKLDKKNDEIANSLINQSKKQWQNTKETLKNLDNKADQLADKLIKDSKEHLDKTKETLKDLDNKADKKYGKYIDKATKKVEKANKKADKFADKILNSLKKAAQDFNDGFNEPD